MNKPHKWAKEIKAWADGLAIEYRVIVEGLWVADEDPSWNGPDFEFRIKPDPREWWVGLCDGEIFTIHASAEESRKYKNDSITEIVHIREVLP